MAQHSSIIGGSTAGRIIECPASHQATLALPPTLTDLPSVYAQEGSDMHDAMSLIAGRRKQIGFSGGPEFLLNMTAGGRTITREHIDLMLAPALDALARLEEIYGGGFEVIGIEQRVKFPRIPGAFGTCDLILQSKTHTIVADWKFGSGVGVRAVYSDPVEAAAYVNPQLMYYLAAAKHSFPGWFRKRRMVIAIIQPRSNEPLTHTEVSPREVTQFIEDAEFAVLAAIGRDPPRVKGEWCRFAPCKTTCPLWTGPLLELAQLIPGHKVPPAPVTPGSGYGAYLAHAKALIDTLVLLKTTIDEQMHTYLEKGGQIPGWRLKHKAKMRQWVDPKVVEPALKKLGFEDDQIWQEKLVTFQSADATAKKLGVTIPDDLRVAPPATETTLATTDDPAPVVEPAKLVEMFSASLKLLQQEKR